MKKIKITTLKIDLANAKINKLFYFVSTGVIYHPKRKKCLILQRSKREIVHPLIWGVVGGKMEWQDLKNNSITRMNIDIPNWEGLVEKQLEREAYEESGLKTYDPRFLETVVFVRPDNVPVVCIKYALKYKSGKVKIPLDFEDFAWVDYEESKKYQCMLGIPEEIKKTIEIYGG